MLVPFVDSGEGRVTGFKAGLDGARAAVDKPLQGLDSGLAAERRARPCELDNERQIVLLCDVDGCESRHG